jgi:hypothetical protein
VFVIGVGEELTALNAIAKTGGQILEAFAQRWQIHADDCDPATRSRTRCYSI